MSPTVKSAPHTFWDKLKDALPGILLGGLVAFSTSYIGVQRGQAVIEQRVTTVEQNITSNRAEHSERLKTVTDEMIRRKEFEAYQQGLNEQLRGINAQLKSISGRQFEVLTRLPDKR
jgi:hypothetical protein